MNVYLSKNIYNGDEMLFSAKNIMSAVKFLKAYPDYNPPIRIKGMTFSGKRNKVILDMREEERRMV